MTPIELVIGTSTIHVPTELIIVGAVLAAVSYVVAKIIITE